MYSVGLDVDTRAYFTAATSFVFCRIHTKSIQLKNSLSNQLVIWEESQGSSIGPIKINQYVRNSTKLTPKVEGVLVGALLSDGWFQKQKPNWNARFAIKQSFKSF